MSRDGPDSATEQQCVVEEGDIVVAASDGLFDNLHESQIAGFVTRRPSVEEGHNENENEEKVKAQRDGTADLTAAEVLGVHALSVARSCSANSPFAEAM